MSWLLDTCILVDLMRRNSVAERVVSAASDQPFVCAVSSMELYTGARSQREESAIDAIIGLYHLVQIEPIIFQRAGVFLRHYRASHGIDIPDALIAATAEYHGLKLATLNTKHFPMFKGLKPAY
jgi:predicted nucleic acid-binding protein